MTSINDVPLEDIKLFLKNNKITIPKNQKDIYKKAFDLIINPKGISSYPDSLIDWIIAYNLANEGKDILIYTRGEIDLMNQKELQELAEYLGIEESNNVRQSVINILKYLQKLNNLVVLADIDKSIFQILDEQRLLDSSYGDIIKIFQKNKTLRKFIYDNMKRIIFLIHP